MGIVTFCVSRRRHKMYCGHARLCVCVCLCLCVSLCLSAAVRPHYCTDLDVTWGHGRGCPLVVHCWADLQSGHRLCCYGNITWTLVTSLRPSRDIMTVRTADWAGSARVAGRRTAGAPKTVRCIREAGPAGRRVAFSTSLRQSGMRASTGGVLATKKRTQCLVVFANNCYLQMLVYHWNHHHNFFTALFPGPPEWVGARKELLDFMVQGKTNRGRHTDHPAGCHSIWTKQWTPPPFPPSVPLKA